MGAFRALRLSTLSRLSMQDEGFGWNIEMQLKAIHQGLTIKELELPYEQRRAGKSKISENPRAVLKAGAMIIYTAFRYARP